MSRPTSLGRTERATGVGPGGVPNQPPTPDCCTPEEEMPDRGLNDNGAYTVSLNSGFPFVGAVEDTESVAAGTSLAVGMPSGIVVDATQALLAVAVATGDGSAVTMTGWTILANATNGGVRTTIFGRDPTGTEGASMTLSSPTSQELLARVFRIVGCDGLAGLEAAVGTTASTANPNPPSLNPSGWGTETTLWMAVVGGGDSGTTISAYPTDYTNGSFVGIGGGPTNPWLATCQRELEAASEDPGAFTLNTARVSNAFTVAIRPSGSGAIWVIPQPNTGDDDDATFGSVAGTELLQRDLGAPYRIVSQRLRLETSGTGVREYTVRAWNELDESDAVVVTTVAFTATGSPQDVAFEYENTEEYRFWQLDSDTSEDVLVYSWEMYEPTLATNHQHAASGVFYNNTASGLTADDVQEAIDELAAGGGGSIVVTDGTTTVSPTGTVSFDPAFFDVTSPGGAVAGVTFIGGTGTDLGWFNVMDFGATGDGSTDDTSAIQDTIDACAAAGGGTVYFPPGVYIIGGALQDTGAFNGQLLLPDVDVADDPITIRFLGANPPPISYHGTLPTPGAYSFLKSTLTGASGTAAMLSGGNGSYPGTQNNVQVILENLFAIPEDDDPTFTVFNLAACQGGGVRAVFVVPEPVFAGTVTEPTHTNSYALKLPQARNSNGTFVDGFGASVMYVGLLQGEMARTDRLAFGYCKVAVEFQAVEHGSHIVQMHATGCPTVLKATGFHACDIDLYDFETTTGPAWTDIDFDLDDASDFLHGTAWGYTGFPLPPTHVFTKNGGDNFNAFVVGELPAGAAALDDLTDVTITAPAADDDLRYNGSVWVNDARRWEAVTDGEDVFVWEGDDLVHEWSTP